mmetsp:Transcript_3173/g.12758  ORF Transcript_3173/g.12758 Transcript_3173/m.12758 type:complete len:172 (-) Transcript_3173:61-576(-)
MNTRVMLLMSSLLASGTALRVQPRSGSRIAPLQRPVPPSASTAASGKDDQLGEVAMGMGVLLAMNAVAPQTALAAEAWVKPVSVVLGPAVNIAILMFLMRTVLSWYPNKNLNKLPWNIVAWPTEPVLSATRKVVPPAFGVDISPIVWIFILSFINETLLGPQGLFTIMLSK